MPFCTQCGADVSGVRFCAQCGAPASESGAARAAPPQPEAAAQPGGQAAGGAAAGSAPAAGAVPPTGGPEVDVAPEGAPEGAPGSAPVAGSQDIAAALAYVTPLAVLFLVIEPFNKDRLVRFHCMQSLLLFGGLMVGYVGLAILGAIFSVIGVGFFFAPLQSLIVLGFFVLAVFGAIKAFQGKKFHLPLVGEWAARKS